MKKEALDTKKLHKILLLYCFATDFKRNGND